MMAHSTPYKNEAELTYLYEERGNEFQSTFYLSEQTDELTRHLFRIDAKQDWKALSLTVITENKIPKSYCNLYLDGLLVKAHDPNQLFRKIHQHLSADHHFAFRVATAENIKSNILERYPYLVFWLYYPFHFLGCRVLPKLKGFRKISRLLRIPVDMSKSEIMGRLIYQGFQIVDIQEIQKETVFIAKPHAYQNPSKTAPAPSEGIVFTMKRVGKNDQPITVYKFRSMHPYAEYAQEYLHQTNGLDEGGKFKNDFRVSTGGRLLRKYWIDEIPMIVNLLKGDIKLVGVRPISEHYFSLYPEEVRQVRTRHKPGLLPPFYADLPKTFEEIVASELKYMEAYEKAPLRTELVYLGKILKNIFIKKARSK